MAIEQGIWKIGDKPEKRKPVDMADESLLEEQVMHDIAILNAGWLLIGHQVRTDFDNFIDLLALNGDGNVIERELAATANDTAPAAAPRVSSVCIPTRLLGDGDAQR